METTQYFSDEHINHGGRVLAVAWVEFGITVPFVASRIFTRARVIHNLGWDDWTILIAMVSRYV